MALQTNTESLALKEVTLSELVAMSNDCVKTCWDRTSRIVDNQSRAPRGWEGIFNSVARQRRDEDNELCMKFCTHVKTSCPESPRIVAYEKADRKKVTKGNELDGIPTVQEMTRCEHAVEKFSNVLFTLAHKPSKVSFASATSPEEQTKDANEPPTEAHKKVLQGSKLDEEITRRWSAARQGRLHMEEQGILRSAEAAEEFKQEMIQKDRKEKAAGGTTPRW